MIGLKLKNRKIYEKIINFIKENWFKLCILIILLVGVYYVGIRSSYLVKRCTKEASYSSTLPNYKVVDCLVERGYPVELQINS
jgi:hypothetical protein